MSAKLLDELLKKLRFNIKAVIKSDLSEVILYGSYARSDFDEESDVDIVVNISCIPLKDFEEYKEVLPYYRNIDSGGVRIVA